MLNDGLVVHLHLSQFGCDREGYASHEQGVIDANVADQRHRLESFEVEEVLRCESCQECGVCYIVIGVEQYIYSVIQSRDQEKLVNFEGVSGPLDLATLEIKSLRLVDNHDKAAACHHLGNVVRGLTDDGAAWGAQGNSQPLSNRIQPFERRIHYFQVGSHAAEILVNTVIGPKPLRLAVVDDLLRFLRGGCSAIHVLASDSFKQVCHVGGVIEGQVEARPIDVSEGNEWHLVLLVVGGVLKVQIDHRRVVSDEFDEVEDEVPHDDTDEQQ